MALCLLPFCFVVTFISIAILLGNRVDKRDILIATVLAFSGYTLLITELLSAFSAIACSYIVLLWAIIIFINIVFIYINKKKAASAIKSLNDHIVSLHQTVSKAQKLWFLFIIIVMLLVFVQGIIYPPNNWDSMTYHLARISSWVSRGSAGQFPSHIFSQVFQPPLAEYIIMHVNLLAGNDYFSAAVQFCFFMASMVTLSSIVKKLGMPGRYQALVIVFCAFIPEALLQASSTQNNMVEAFFVLAAYYFSLRAISELKFKNYFLLGMATGLALLTRDTAYIYLLPVLLFFSVNVFIKLFKTKDLKFLWYAVFAAIIGLVINCGQYQRNYTMDKNLFGTRESDMKGGINADMGLALLISNIVKNAGLQMGIMGSSKPSEIADAAIHKLHQTAGINIDDQANNFARILYKLPTGRPNHEDSAPNFLHFLLLIMAFALIVFHWLRSRQNALVLQLFIIVLLQVILFCWFIKWQAWNTRMHMEFLLLGAPVFCYAVSISRLLKRITYVAIPVILLYGFVLVLHNATRPYIVFTKQKPYLSVEQLFEPRYEKYFTNRTELYPEYAQVNQAIQTANYKNIGLILGYNDWQYPLFTNYNHRELNPVHLFVNNPSNNMVNLFTNVDCIVSTIVNRAYIDYNGRRFYNTDGKNKFIYLYK